MVKCLFEISIELLFIKITPSCTFTSDKIKFSVHTAYVVSNDIVVSTGKSS